jgi:cysteine-rich repeat protein
MTSRLVGLLSLVIGVAACSYDPIVAPGAEIDCAADSDCPADDQCLKGRCHAPTTALPSLVVSPVLVNEDQPQEILLNAVPAEQSVRFEVLEAPQRGKLLCAFGVEICAEGCVDVSACEIQDARLIYTPSPDANGDDAFVMRVINVDEPELVSDPTTVPVEIQPQPDSPQIVDLVVDGTDLLQGDSVDIEVQAVDADDDPLFVSVVAIEKGTLTRGGEPVTGPVPLTRRVGAKGEFTLPLTFTADAGASGRATLTLEVSDSPDAQGLRDRADLELRVLRELKVFGENVVIDEDSAAEIFLAGQGEGDVIFSIPNDASPTDGAATIEGDTLTYTPNADWFGTDCFGVVGVVEGEVSAPAEICVEVNAVNDPPVAQTLPVFVTTEDTPLDVDLSAFVVDVDDEVLTCQVEVEPSKGAASFAGLTLQYRPALNENGFESFLVSCTDGEAAPVLVDVAINVERANDPPTCVGCGGTVQVTEDVTRTLDLNTLFSDVEQQPLSCELVSAPALGTVTFLDATTIEFDPALDQNGADAFTVRCTDGEASSPDSVVNVDIVAVNDPPVCNDCVTPFLVDEDAILNTDLATRFQDPEGDALSCSVRSAPLLGEATIIGKDLSYTPDADKNGDDAVIVVCADDGGAEGDPQSISISITPQPDLATLTKIADVPVEGGTLPTVTTDEDTEVFFVVEGEDVDGQAVSFEWRDPDQAGSTFAPANLADLALSRGVIREVLNLDDLAVVSFTPNLNVTGSQRVEVRPATQLDDQGTPASQSLVIDITPVNDPPTIIVAAPTPVFLHDLSVNLPNSTVVRPVTIPFSTFTNDVDGDPLTVTVLQDPIGLTGSGEGFVGLIVIANGFLTLQPAEEFLNATATVQITDNLSEPVIHTIEFEGRGQPDCSMIRNTTHLRTGVRLLDPGAPGDNAGEEPRFFAQCEMDSSGGGWTMTTRVLGGDGAVGFQDAIWTSTQQPPPVLNPDAPDYEFTDAMLMSFHTVEVSQLLLGFQTGADVRPRMLLTNMELAPGTTELASLRDAFDFSSIPLTTRTPGGTPAEARAHWLQAVGAVDADYPPACNEVALRGDASGIPNVRVGLLASDTDCLTPTAFAGIGALATTTAGGEAPSGFTEGALGSIWVRGQDFTDDLPEQASCAVHQSSGAKLDGLYQTPAGPLPCDFLGNDSVCRDGIVEEPEECDDGNGVDGDTCDTNCTVPQCGNGIISVDENGVPETCDPPDGTSCDATCQIIGGSS